MASRRRNASQRFLRWFLQHFYSVVISVLFGGCLLLVRNIVLGGGSTAIFILLGIGLAADFLVLCGYAFVPKLRERIESFADAIGS